MFLMYFRLRFSFKRSSFALNRKWRRHFELIQFIVLLMVTWLEKWHHWVQVYTSYIAKHKLNTNPMLTCQIVIKALLLSPPNTSHVHSTHTHSISQKWEEINENSCLLRFALVWNENFSWFFFVRSSHTISTIWTCGLFNRRDWKVGVGLAEQFARKQQ